MVVLVVDQNSILAIEGERDAPIATDGHRPATFQLALQLVQSQTGQVHVLWGLRSRESTKHESQSAGMLGAYARPVSGKEEALEPAVTEAHDHASIVTLQVTPSSGSDGIGDRLKVADFSPFAALQQRSGDLDYREGR